MATSSYEQSARKIAQTDQLLATQGIAPIRKDTSHGHLDYQLMIGPTTGSVPAGALTTATTVDFDLKYQPGSYLKSNRSITLAIAVAESSGTASVKPTLVESFFDKNRAVEWLCDQSPISAPCPMIQMALEPAMELSDAEYSSLCQVLNHNTSFAGNVSVASGGTAIYFVRVPNFFDKQGIWLGAIGSHIWTARFHTQPGGAVDSGSGTLVVTGMALILDTIVVPQSEFDEMRREWDQKAWVAQECLLNEPNAINLVSSGQSPAIQLAGFKDRQISSIYTLLHTAKTFPSSAYWTTAVSPANSAKITILDRNNNQLFCNNGEYYGYQRYCRGVSQLADSRMLQNFPWIFSTPSPNLQQRIHLGPENDEGNSKFYFTGDETIVLSDLGSSATGVYVDSAGFSDTHFVLRGGSIVRLG